MGAPNDLTTLANVKMYAQTTNPSTNTLTQDDALIGALITGLSQSLLQLISRFAILRATYTDVFDGTGGEWMGQMRALRYRPTLSVSALSINGSAVPPISSTTTPNGSGYTFDPWDGVPPGRLQFLKLSGYGFTPNWAPNNCSVTYTAGFGSSEEWAAAASVVPASPNGLLVRDDGVTYVESGKALVRVADDPDEGEYVPPNPLSLPASTTLPSGPTSDYIFAEADYGSMVDISYSYVPTAIEMAARMWIADQYKYTSRLGERTVSQGGVITAGYNIVDMPSLCKLLLGPYIDVNPYLST